MSKSPAETGRALALRGREEGVSRSVPPGPDRIVTRHVSWWRWHRIQRRHQKALDRHLEPPSPWVFATAPDHDVYADPALTYPERQYAGWELRKAGWSP